MLKFDKILKCGYNQVKNRLILSKSKDKEVRILCRILQFYL